VTGSLGLVVVLVSTALVLAAAALWKQPCAGGNWGDGRQYRPPRICYSDIVPLYGTERLQGGRLPYLDHCEGQCDEYPVVTMYFMRTAAWISNFIAELGSGSCSAGTSSNCYPSFFYVNAAFLFALALVTALLLYRLAGLRALYFGVASSLLIYAFVNWDLVAVVLATAGTYAYLRDRDSMSGALLGLGAAAKLYPGFLVVPFVLGRLKRRNTAGAAQLAVWSVTAYALVNLPFALAAPHSWATFFRFNANRPADWDSLWFVACQRLHGGTGCSWSPHVLDRLSLVVFVVAAVALYAMKRWRHPDFPRWTFGFPLLVAFLLSNKVYSPQYGLWLLPWFALSLPNPWLFGAFEAADIAVFFTRFTWFGRFDAQLGSSTFAGFHGTPLGGFELAVVIRAVILLACLAAWVLRTPGELSQRLETVRRRPLLEGAA